MRKYIFVTALIALLLIATGIANLQTFTPTPTEVPQTQPLPEGDLDLNQIIVTFIRDGLGTIAGSSILGYVLMRLAPYLLDITKGIAMASAKANADLMDLLETLVTDLKETTGAIKVTLDNGIRVQDNLLEYLKTSHSLWDAKLTAIQAQLDLINRRLDAQDAKDVEK